MSKWMTAMLMTALMAALLCGCGQEEKAHYTIAESGSWTDGSYTETAKGKNGSFDVTVTIEGGVISDITVGDNQETPDKGGVAILQLPDAMVKAQSPDVDAVTGATVTSNAIKDAVYRCLEKAS